jgi:hypothetical protein
VKAHPALPQFQQVLGVGDQFGGIEHRITQPSAQNDAQRGVEEQVIGMALRQGRARLTNHPQQVCVAQNDARKVCQRVPFDREEPQVQRDG